jgi:hypothetical protein
MSFPWALESVSTAECHIPVFLGALVNVQQGYANVPQLNAILNHQDYNLTHIL